MQADPTATGSAGVGASEVQAEISSQKAEHVSGEELVEPPKKVRRTNIAKQPLIAKPPVLPSHVTSVAEAPSGPAKGDLEAQQRLKKELEQKAKDEALEKKEKAEAKKQKSVQDAVLKAEAKLNQAKAKAAALQQKMDGKRRGVRRNLAKELENASESVKVFSPPRIAKAKGKAQAKAKAKSSPESKRKGSRDNKPNVKLSPKAKQFATGTKSMTKALEALESLQALELKDLPLPEPENLTKKLLVCTVLNNKLYSCKYMFTKAQIKANYNAQHCTYMLSLKCWISTTSTIKICFENYILRSFTLPHPKGPGHGSSIGVVLYQRAFFVSRASAEKCAECLGKEPYPTGSMQVAWEGAPSSA